MLVKPGTTTSRSRLAGSNAVARPRSVSCIQHRHSRLQQALSSPGRHNVASHASSSLLEGPAAAAQDVGELLLRRWMGVDEEGHLPVYEVSKGGFQDSSVGLTKQHCLTSRCLPGSVSTSKLAAVDCRNAQFACCLLCTPQLLTATVTLYSAGSTHLQCDVLGGNQHLCCIRPHFPALLPLVPPSGDSTAARHRLQGHGLRNAGHSRAAQARALCRRHHRRSRQQLRAHVSWQQPQGCRLGAAQLALGQLPPPG
jgi:hypothetical protein